MKLNLDTANLNTEDLDLARGIVKPNGDLYGSKPKDARGETQYIWRMVAFTLSDKPRHWCLPVTAEFDLPDEYWGKGTETADRRRELTRHLDSIADAITKTVPVMEQPGTARWARAFGVI